MYRKLYLHARNSLHDPHLSEEAVQETARIACTSIDKFYGSPSPEGWLTKTLDYTIRNSQRHRYKMDRYLSLEPDLEVDFAAADTESTEIDLEMRFGDIAKSSDFMLLKRVVLDAYTVQEAAKEFGLPVEVCKKRIQRLRAKLRGMLQNE